MPREEVTLEHIRAAQERIAGRVLRTPVIENALINARCGAQLHFKCENLQEMGAFKARGASNAIFARSAAELRAGVVTHSSGNHGAAVARAARLRGVRARVVMPHNSSRAKLAAVRGLRRGGHLVRADAWRRARRPRRGLSPRPARCSCTRTTIPTSSPARARSRSSCSSRCPHLDWLLLSDRWRRPDERPGRGSQGPAPGYHGGRGRAGRCR